MDAAAGGLEPAADEGSRARVPRWLPVALVPLAFLAVASWLAAVKGPFWLGPSFDPDYAYLTNALLVATGRPPVHVDHPGTAAQLLFAGVLRLAHPGASADELAAAVLARPEAHLVLVQRVLFVLLAAVLWVVGALTLRATGSVAGAVWLQAAPLLSPTLLAELLCVKAEPVVAAAALLAGAIVFAAGPRALTAREGALLGLLCAVGASAKITALPLCALPLLAARGRRGRVAFALSFAVVIGLLSLPALPNLERLSKLTQGFLLGTGRYGAGGPPANPGGTAVALLLLLAHDVELPLALAMAGAALVTLRRSGARMALSSPWPFALTLLLHVAAVAVHPFEPRYWISGLALVGPTTLSAALVLGPRAATFSGPRARALALAFLVGLGATRSLWTAHGQLASRVQGAARLDAFVAEQERGVPVLPFYGGSSPVAALQFGNWWSAGAFGGLLDRAYPEAVAYDIWVPAPTAFSGPLPLERAVTSHRLLLRGVDTRRIPALGSAPELQTRLASTGEEAVYLVRLPPSLSLAFGDYRVAGLSRPVAAGRSTGPVRVMTGSVVTLEFDGTEEGPRTLTGSVVNPDPVETTLTAVLDGHPVRSWTIPGQTGGEGRPIAMTLPSGPGPGTVELRLSPGAAARRPPAFTALRVVGGAEPAAVAGPTARPAR